MPTALADLDPEDRPAATLSRRHAAGSESARGLLLTVLGEFVLPTGGSVWTSTIIDVLGRLGTEEKAARQALLRTADAGLLTSRRHGRRTRWTLSASGTRLLTEGTERIYGFTGTHQDWDGNWLLVLARVPETDRAARHLLRTRLRWAGLGSPTPGVWISTHPQRVAEASSVLEEAGMLADAQIFVGQHYGGADLATLVRQAWDLDAIEAGYETFAENFKRQPTKDPLARLTLLVHAWRRFPLIDPALPASLLPAHWSGATAARLFHRQHDKWTTEATAEWQRLTDLES